ncbi:hypothetical protein BC332_34459 [Capsicum chinense]|nr:hypothetical protein BC332_34459 [Capsicum chinense]
MAADSLSRLSMGSLSHIEEGKREMGHPGLHGSNAFYGEGLDSGHDTRSAFLIFCTASRLLKLHMKGMTPLEMVVIDEAAQLKECESTIPLQLLGLCHAILIGDEKQLPSMVESMICKMDEFGRSLLERIVILGHKKHLLNVQYQIAPENKFVP